MAPLGPIDTRHLFLEERAALLALLAGLADEEWHRPTVCTGWTVHDLVLYLLAVDVQNLSAGRDRFIGPPDQPPPDDLSDWDTLVAYINGRNVSWVEATRRISPRLARELLHLTGELMDAFLATVDLDTAGIPVSWVGPDPAPAWLHCAREYTERWVHQQQIRDAVGRPGFTEPRSFAPVLDAFARALPHALRAATAPPGTAVRLIVTGAAGGTWTTVREGERWTLDDDHTRPAAATVTGDRRSSPQQRDDPERETGETAHQGNRALVRAVAQAHRQPGNGADHQSDPDDDPHPPRRGAGHQQGDRTRHDPDRARKPGRPGRRPGATGHEFPETGRDQTRRHQDRQGGERAERCQRQCAAGDDRGGADRETERAGRSPSARLHGTLPDSGGEPDRARAFDASHSRERVAKRQFPNFRSGHVCTWSEAPTVEKRTALAEVCLCRGITQICAEFTLGSGILHRPPDLPRASRRGGAAGVPVPALRGGVRNREGVMWM